MESPEFAAKRAESQHLYARQHEIQRQRAALDAEERELGDRRAILFHEIGELMLTEYGHR